MNRHFSKTAPVNRARITGQLLVLAVLVFTLLAASGCKASEKTVKPPVLSVTGAIITDVQTATPVIRAYGPAFQVTFDTSANTLPTVTGIIVNNVRADAVVVAGLIPAKVTVLSPTSVQYEFMVTPGVVNMATFSVPTGPELSFAVMGDNRDGRKIYTKLINTLNEAKPAFVINGGDLVSSGQESQYETFLADSAKFTMPYFTALGNHDIANGGRVYYNKLLSPDYYDFVWGNAQFIVLDNADGKMNEQQLAWLEQKLQNRASQHVFLVMHKPTFDPRPGGTHTVDTQELADRLEQMAAKYKVTAVFASHIHMYYQGERLGIPYYITGGAGAPLYANADEGGIYHYLLVKIKGSQVIIEKTQLNQE
jgi:3',5'-cyclic AMP phosphodiesterase CpdA